MEKREHCYIVGGNADCAATVENSMEVSQKTKNRTTIGPRNSTPGYIFKNKNTNLKRALTPMFTEALLIVAKT